MNIEPAVAVAKTGSTLGAIAAAIVIAIVMGLLIAIQQIRVVTLQGAVTVERDAKQTAIDANKDGVLGVGEYVKLVQALAPNEAGKGATK